MSESHASATIMNITDSTTDRSSNAVKITLRTADQYQIWKARATAACWGATRLEVFELSDEKCDLISAAFKRRREAGQYRQMLDAPHWIPT